MAVSPVEALASSCWSCRVPDERGQARWHFTPVDLVRNSVNVRTAVARRERELWRCLSGVIPARTCRGVIGSQMV